VVLVDHQIRDAVEQKHLCIENFDETCLQPASYDLRIGSLVYSPSLPNPDKPYDLSKNGGAYRIQPYGSAVLMTHETLKLPSDMIGRFGLKSGFARRGLFASTGPQVDPGFDGKLFVSVLNLTPASHVLSYQETFLSIEFHTLGEKPEKIYEGPYQHKRDIGPEILADLVRLEGLNLSQMQHQFTELSQHVKEWSGLATRFDEFLAVMDKQSTALETLTKQLAAGLGMGREAGAKARRMTLKQAKTEIVALFRKSPTLFYSDIAEALGLDYETVIKATEQLEKEGIIEASKNEKRKTKTTGKKNQS
jgi:dCTP deaminase